MTKLDNFIDDKGDNFFTPDVANPIVLIASEVENYGFNFSRESRPFFLWAGFSPIEIVRNIPDLWNQKHGERHTLNGTDSIEIGVFHMVAHYVMEEKLKSCPCGERPGFLFSECYGWYRDKRRPKCRICCRECSRKTKEYVEYNQAVKEWQTCPFIEKESGES